MGQGRSGGGDEKQVRLGGYCKVRVFEFADGFIDKLVEKWKGKGEGK